MHGRSPIDHVVGQDDRERLVADEVLGHEHRVAEAELLLLADVGDLRQVADLADLAEHLDVALLLEQVLELVGQVEVVLDGALLAGGDDDDLLDPGGDGLLDRVLDDRLVDQRQHLLGLRLGGRQEACAPPGGGEDSLANAHRTSVGRVWEGRGSIPRALPRARPARPGPRPRAIAAKRRIAASKAAGRSRFERCEAPASRTRRGCWAARTNGRPHSRNGRSYSPLRSRVGPG